MNVKVIGITESVITLNELGVILHGKVDGIFNIETKEQKNELDSLEKASLITVEEILVKKITKITTEKSDIVEPPVEPIIEDIVEPVVEDTEKLTKPKPKSKGRPKGAKNKKKSKSKPKSKGRPKGAKNKKKEPEQNLAAAAEAETQKMGSDVVVATGDGTMHKVAMRNTFAGNLPESEATEESLKALDKLNEIEQAEMEEREPEVSDQSTINEDQLDPSEQMGRKAVISDAGTPLKTDMKNSIVPGADEARGRDPFIDKAVADKAVADKARSKSETSDPFVDSGTDAPKKHSAFIDENPSTDDNDDRYIEI